MSTMLLNHKIFIDSAVHRQNVQVLVDKISGADAILGGALRRVCQLPAASTSSIKTMRYLSNTWETSTENMDLPVPSMDFTTVIRPRRPTGPSLPEWVTWSMNVPQVSPIMT